MSGPVTLRDLSRSLGLSESTVSKALNGRTDVSQEVRSKVLEAAHSLGYVPNRTARGLALGTSGMLGVFLLNRFGRGAGEYFGFNFLGGIMKETQERGYDVLVFQESEELSRCGYLEYARRRGVEGVILIGLWPDDPLARFDPGDPLPWVSVDAPVAGMPDRLVTTDNRGGIEKIVEAVHARGHRRIGYVGIHGGGYVGTERRAGFESIAGRLGVFDSRLAVDTAVNMEAGSEATRKLLSLPDRPSAIVCATDLQAIGVLRTAREIGLRVPEDLAVTGFDNISSSALTYPALTTVKQDTDGIAKAAIGVLLNPKLAPMEKHMIGDEYGEGATSDEDLSKTGTGGEPFLVPASLVLRDSL